MRTVVGRIHDESVVRDTLVIQRFKDRVDVLVMVDDRVVVGLCQRPDWPTLSGLVWVRKCMWVKFPQTKNGLLAAFCRWMKSTARLAMSSSIVTIRFLGQRSGVLAHLLADLAEARFDCRIVDVVEALQSSTPRGPYLARNAGSFG